MSFPSVAPYSSFEMAPFLAIAAGSICFLIPALINGFPFVYPDTVDYLIFTPRLYRSPFYGLFIFFFHLNRFIWAPVIAQAFIASHLVWVLVRIHAGGSSVRYFGFMVIILVCLSSLPFFVGFIMPDIFTPIMILVFYILGFHLSALSRLERLYFVLLGCVAVAAHISHLTQALALVSAIIIIQVFLRTPFRVALTRSTILSIPLVLSAIAILLNNIVVHHSVALFPAGQSFLLANMIEQGPARRYLQERCPAAGYRICSIIDSVPRTAYEVLWAPDGAYQNLGGFEGMREEAKQIVMSTFLSRPWDVLQMAVHTVGLSFVNHAPGADLHSLGQSRDIWMVDVLTKKFGLSTVRAHEDSLQSQDATRALLQAVDSMNFPIATVGLLISGIFAFRRGLQEATVLAILVPAAYAINNTLCAFASGISDRYQARVTWLFALAGMLIIIQLFESSRNKSLSGGRPSGNAI